MDVVEREIVGVVTNLKAIQCTKDIMGNQVVVEAKECTDCKYGHYMKY